MSETPVATETAKPTLAEQRAASSQKKVAPVTMIPVQKPPEVTHVPSIDELENNYPPAEGSSQVNVGVGEAEHLASSVDNKTNETNDSDTDKRLAHAKRQERHIREQKKQIDEDRAKLGKFTDKFRENNNKLNDIQKDPLVALKKHFNITPDDIYQMLYDRRDEFSIKGAKEREEEKLPPAVQKRLDELDRKQKERDDAEARSVAERAEQKSNDARRNDITVIADHLKSLELPLVNFAGEEAYTAIRDECYRTKKLKQSDFEAVARRLEKIYEKHESDRLTALKKSAPKLFSEPAKSVTKPAPVDHDSDRRAVSQSIIVNKPNSFLVSRNERQERYAKLVRSPKK